MDENVIRQKFKAGNNNREYKMQEIKDSSVYSKEIKGNLPGLYYLIFWKDYPQEKTIWGPTLVVWHLQKLINIFYKNHFDMLIAIFPLVNNAPLMAKSIAKLSKFVTKPKSS